MNKTLIIIISLVIVATVAIGGGIWWMQKSKTETVTPVVNDSFALPTNIPVSPTLKVEEMETTPAPGTTKEFTVTGSNFKFSPTSLKVKKGDTVKITFKNTVGFHDFVIDEFDVQTNQIGEGDEEEVEFVADKVGTFEYYCSVGNHRKMGMVGKLIVE